MLWVGPECNHDCSYKRVAEGEEIQTEEEVIMRGWWQRQEDVATSQGLLAATRSGRGNSALESLEGV